MFSVVAFLFIIGALMVVVGFVGRVGTNGLSDVNANAASAIGLLAVYCIIIAGVGSSAELVNFFEGIFGTVPYNKRIAKRRLLSF